MLTDDKTSHPTCSITDVAATCGEAVADELVRCFPGYRLEIPDTVPLAERLPAEAHKVLREIGETCGEDVAIALVKHYGGQRLYIPIRLRPNHHLVVSLGQELAEELAYNFGGDRIVVPRFNSHHPAAPKRRVLILSLLQEGKKVREVAAEARCTTARVYQIIAAERARTGRNPRRPRGNVVALPAPNENDTMSSSKPGAGRVVPFKDGGR